MSGYLIWYSVQNNDAPTYFKKRFFRIYPELWVAVIVEMIVLLQLYTQPVPLKDILLFSFTQGTLFQFWTPDSLRGYGNGTPNGALWTITVIVQFYVVAWFLYRFLKKRKFGTWILALIISIAVSVGLNRVEGLIPEVLFKLIRNSFVPYMWLFIAGAFVARYADRALPALKKYWWAFIAVAVLLIISHLDIAGVYYPIFKSLAVGCGFIGMAYRYPKINIPVDFSYELYLYHVTVVNAMLTLGYTGKIDDLFIVFAISICLAVISKETVGRIGTKKVQ